MPNSAGPSQIVVMIKKFALTLLIGVSLASGAAVAQDRPDLAAPLRSGTVAEAAERLKPGQFLWAPQIAPQGPVLLVVSVKTQRAIVYRNGVPIGISTVSTGRPGYETPTGVFVILQKHVEHYSNLYDDAPMPYMQRLTWGGIALHAGKLPGYPASHGCVRLPPEFARLLFGITKQGMTVVITHQIALPRVAPAEALLGAGSGLRSSASIDWNPSRAPEGPLSIVISSADRRLVVLRQGIVIGSLPVEIDGTIERTSAFLLDSVVNGERNWVRIALGGPGEPTSEQLRGRIHISEEFRRLVDPVVKIGTTVVVTADSVQTGAANAPLTVIESDRGN
jgi:hypothetical protein